MVRESTTRIPAIKALKDLGVHAARTDVVSALMGFVRSAPLPLTDHTALWDTQSLAFHRRIAPQTIEHTVEWAAQALGVLRATGIAPELMDQPMVGMLDNEDPHVWSRGILLLEYSSSPPFEPGITDSLTQLLLESESWQVRASVGRRLGRCVDCKGRDRIISVLREALEKDANEHVRFAAAGSLTRFGDAAANEVIPDLICDSEHSGVRVQQVFAAEAVGAMGSSAATSEVLPVLLACLRTHNLPLVQTQAAYVIGGMGRVAATPEVISTLVECLKDPMPPISALSTQFSAIRALGKMADWPATLEAIPALLKVYTHGWETSSAAMRAIVAIWGDRVPQDRIHSLLNDAREGQHASKAIRLLCELKWSEAPPELVPILLDWMRRGKGCQGVGFEEDVLRLSTEDDTAAEAISIIVSKAFGDYYARFSYSPFYGLYAGWVIQPISRRFCHLKDMVDLTKNEEWREFTLPRNAGEEVT